MESTTAVEERLSALEQRLATMECRFADLHADQHESNLPKRGWQAIVGKFANDPLYDEAMRLGREWRDAQRDEVEAES